VQITFLIDMQRFPYIIFCVFVVFLSSGHLHADNDQSTFDHIKVEFELVNGEGSLITERDFAGRYILLAFGFTHCAHICPMMAANMSLVLKSDNTQATGVFISLDSERDTPQITQDYASSFGKSMMGLSGSYEQVGTAAENFGVSFVVTKSNKAYTVEHSSDIFLIGPDGQVIDVFSLGTPAKDMAFALALARHNTENVQ
jgi:protein SCO1/2